MQFAVLFGAGASFGSDVSGTPPLGSLLFDALQDFNPQGWGALSDQYCDQFRTDFEAAIAEYAQAYPNNLPPLQRAMAAFFFQFQPRISSLYVNLASRMAETEWDGAVCSLNYERLMELSLDHVGLKPIANSPTTPGQTVELCLPHGCCHIYCDSVRGLSSAVSFAGFNVRTSGPVSVIVDPIEHRTRVEQDAFPPVMSYFEPNKRTTTGASFINLQRERWAEIANEAQTIVLVGIKVRPHDTHIWGPLANTSAKLVYCSGPESAREFENWSKKTRSRNSDETLSSYFYDGFETICIELGI